MKSLKKITAAALSLLLLGSAAVPAFAEGTPNEKEEVIYIMTDAAGKVTDIEAVNIFEGGDITDYGDYSVVKILNTTDKLTQNGNKITFSSKSARVYYQGTVKNTEIPWNISIRYFLDGKEYSAKDIAGKSGELELRFSVSKNIAYKGGFYDSHALQASFTLDTDICKNIVSSGATVANVGSSRQLTYTVLPGKGIDTVIKAEVADFEMNSVEINSVRLNMNFEVDKSVLTDKVNELSSAAGDLNGGASEVRNGAARLSGAAETLNGKIGELNGGVGKLTDGAGSLSSGLADITAQNTQLTAAAYKAYEGLCTAAAAALNGELKANGMDTVTLTPSSYSAILGDLLKKLGADTAYNEAYNAALRQVTAQVEAHADTLYRGYIESQADSIYLSYVSSQADTIYNQAAAQAVYKQLIMSGYTEAQAEAFLQTPDGQVAVAQAAAALTEEQKAQLLNAAVSNLTDEQKEQILAGTVSALTDEQKAEIRNGYIKQMMASEEVTSQINAAVAAVGAAAGQVSELKGQLDSYGAFYKGLLDYTDAVGEAAAGAKDIALNMDTLYSNTERLNVSVGELSGAVNKLYGGTAELANGTARLLDETSGIDAKIDDEIDSMISSLTGSDTEIKSFVSDENTNVKSVQFVIKTAAVKKAEAAVNDGSAAAPLTFWQKLLRLFGLY